ncbi:sterile alpha motif domain containing 1a isoform X2 [Syngnathus typhle]|uniref:sterile alpha motif domain containing 1a isoform X2 n=1 Tax=Syngnathus typhle TaxID=161592 RepID=UPI002A6A5ECD|nr:sterile alpha motif domain containing 1a isoform X2 [Syngnathus typhle]
MIYLHWGQIATCARVFFRRVRIVSSLQSCQQSLRVERTGDEQAFLPGPAQHGSTMLFVFCKRKVTETRKQREKVSSSADTSMAMDTDSNMDEEGGDESRDGQDGPFPSPGPVCLATSAVLRAASAPCSPSHARPAPGPGRSPGAAPGAGLDCVISFQMATARPSSLPASSPKSLTYNNLANGTNGVASCPVERQELGMHTDKVCPVTVHPVAICPSAPKNNLKEEDKMEDSSPLLDQLVPDYAVQLERSGDASQVRVQVLSSSNDCTLKKNAEILASLAQAESVHVNGNDNDKSDELSVKKEKLSQNLLQWTAADVASYFADAGFPEQALAFRTQEIDGKSLLLMQRSDVLTGLSIRLGPALKIYERHIKVLQRSHFLECDDL